MNLLYNDKLVGHLEGVFESQGVWYGNLKMAADSTKDLDVIRALEFMGFCKAWNATQRSAEPRKADEFDEYDSMMGAWTVETVSGTTAQIEDAPNFFADDDEISWMIADQLDVADIDTSTPA